VSVSATKSCLTKAQLWDRYREYRYYAPGVGLSLDVSRVRLAADYLAGASVPIRAAIDALAAVDRGAVANQDENRMVGHYWLRAPELAPSPELRAMIEDGVASVRAFAEQVHRGAVTGADGAFKHLVHVGIGGSSLGPQLLCDAERNRDAPLDVYFLDNADPDGIDSVLGRLDGALGRTLVSVVSKCGWTPTPMRVLSELVNAYERCGLDFSRHAVVTSMVGTELDQRAVAERWLARFPLWQWVGGRTSVTSAVGLLPAALHGVDVCSFLEGAAAMDRLTRARDPRNNPAALLAVMWYGLGAGRGDSNMVVLPYKDRLSLFTRFVQQLVMESIGKRLDRSGAIVHHGLTVYGNKGTTDQHAILQQLRDGRDDFFVTFVYVQQDRIGPMVDIGTEPTLGDYLYASVEGTRNALYERGRDSITITLKDLSPSSLGALVALFERAVGLYAELIDVNAYHQPGVDKCFADDTMELQCAVIGHLRGSSAPQTADEIAGYIGRPEDVETVYKLLERLAKDSRRGVRSVPCSTPFAELYSLDTIEAER
jgi:glucose-6-phosphate isomerase